MPEFQSNKPLRAQIRRWAKAIQQEFGVPPYTAQQLFGTPTGLPPELHHTESEEAIVELVNDFMAYWQGKLNEPDPVVAKEPK